MQGSPNSVQFTITIWISEPGNIHEVCLPNVFEATCTSEQIIMIKSARYGEMRKSSCRNSDNSNIGCKADATTIMDHLCSGKLSCTVDTFAAELNALKPCPPGSKPYLEVIYDCIKGKTKCECLNADLGLSACTQLESTPIWYGDL